MVSICCFLIWGKAALTIQQHPKFTADFIADLLALRRDVLPVYIAVGPNTI